MTSTNLRKAKEASTGVSTIIYVFVALEIIATVVLASDAPSGLLQLVIIFLGIISIFGLLLFYYSWQSIYEVLMHIGSPLEEEHAMTPAEREIRCPKCEQRLNIPSDYTGTATCPACKSQFNEFGDSSSPSDNSPSATTSAPATEGSKRCSYSTSKGIRCKNWFDGEGPHCDDHSEGPQDDIF